MTPVLAGPLSQAKLDANRANALLSTGPATIAGKAASSRNAVSHGLTSRAPILPGESELEYNHHQSAYLRRFSHDPETAAELAGIQWRLRRVPAFEAQMIQLEIDRVLNDPDLEDMAAQLPPHSLTALAFTRLIERKVLTNLFTLENRLERRAYKLTKELTGAASATTPPQQPVRSEPVAETENVQIEPTAAPTPPAPKPAVSHKVGRNEPCPCGSNLKYKRCCGNPVTSAA